MKKSFGELERLWWIIRLCFLRRGFVGIVLLERVDFRTALRTREVGDVVLMAYCKVLTSVKNARGIGWLVVKLACCWTSLALSMGTFWEWQLRVIFPELGFVNVLYQYYNIMENTN